MIVHGPLERSPSPTDSTSITILDQKTWLKPIIKLVFDSLKRSKKNSFCIYEGYIQNVKQILIYLCSVIKVMRYSNKNQ